MATYFMTWGTPTPRGCSRWRARRAEPLLRHIFHGRVRGGCASVGRLEPRQADRGAAAAQGGSSVPGGLPVSRLHPDFDEALRKILQQDRLGHLLLAHESEPRDHEPLRLPPAGNAKQSSVHGRVEGLRGNDEPAAGAVAGEWRME